MFSKLLRWKASVKSWYSFWNSINIDRFLTPCELRTALPKTARDSQTWKTNLWLPKGKAEGGKIRSFGLAYTHYYVLSSYPTRTFCMVQGTILNIL